MDIRHLQTRRVCTFLCVRNVCRHLRGSTALAQNPPVEKLQVSLDERRKRGDEDTNIALYPGRYPSLPFRWKRVPSSPLGRSRETHPASLEARTLERPDRRTITRRTIDKNRRIGSFCGALNGLAMRQMPVFHLRLFKILFPAFLAREGEPPPGLRQACIYQRRSREHKARYCAPLVYVVLIRTTRSCSWLEQACGVMNGLGTTSSSSPLACRWYCYLSEERPQRHGC